MNWLFAKNFGRTLVILCLCAVVGWYTFSYYQTNGEENVVSTTVTLSDITETIVVSGKTEARQIATLTFPVSGIIQSIYPKVGDTVAAGDIIASLTKDALVAEYAAALENVRYLEEIKQELLRGPIQAERAVARNNVQIAEAQITQIETDYTQAIANARKNLLSSGLAAYATSPENDTTPPTVSGNYLCTDEGTYEIYVYRSSASSDYSYNLRNLETGTFVASTDAPTPLGTCGLYIQFVAGQAYHNTTWTVSVPNKRNPQYVSLKSTYDQLITEQATALMTAREKVTLAQSSEQALISPASEEVLKQADANIAAARAQLAAQDARITDYTIKAPFSGMISAIDMKIGESANPSQTIKMVYEGDYELTAQIPEIDITKLSVGNTALVTFDADTRVSFPAKITFISPLSTNLSGVAYYEAHIELQESPSWLREGLNADITIESNKVAQVPTLPRRYIQFVDGSAFVLRKTSTEPELIPITTGFIGTDGRTEIKNLPIGTEVLLP